MDKQFKFSKCDCCRYYGKVINPETKRSKWQCTYSHKSDYDGSVISNCIFDYKSHELDSNERDAFIRNWINANNGIKVEGDK